MNPDTGRVVVIDELGVAFIGIGVQSNRFPIAKVAAKLAVGYTFDELEITGGATPAVSSRPLTTWSKIWRFTFEKFPQAKPVLTTQLKSVGEVMAIGRNFQESMQKALRGLEVGVAGFDPKFESGQSIDELRGFLTEPGPDRVWYVADAFRQGMSLEDVFQLTKIDRWYLVQIQEIVEIENNLASQPLSQMTAQDMRALKRKGFADKRLADLLGVSQREVRRKRQGLGVRPVYKRVDTCAAEFDASTAYMYSSYDEEWLIRPIKTRLWCSVAVRTVSVRVSSLTIAVFTRRLRCVTMATKPSWST